MKQDNNTGRMRASVRTLALALCMALFIGCFAAACQPAVTTSGVTFASPGNGTVTPGDAVVTPGDGAVTPGNALTTPGNADNFVTPGNAVLQGESYTVTREDGSEITVAADKLPMLTQERLDKLMEAFFAGKKVRFFTFDYAMTRAMYQESIDYLEELLGKYQAELDKGAAGHPEQYIETEAEAEEMKALLEAHKAALANAPEDVPNIWMEKPLLNFDTSSSGKLTYEIMDAKAYADNLVYDMSCYRDTKNVGFSCGIYGRNEMTLEEVEAMKPSDGIAWASMVQGLNDETMTVTEMQQAAVAMISRESACEKAMALTSALGFNLTTVDIIETNATYRFRGVPSDTDDSADRNEMSREYGWIIVFSVSTNEDVGITETITVGVLKEGYGQFSWERYVG